MTLKKASYSNLTVNFRQVLVQKYTIVQEVCTNLSTIIWHTLSSNASGKLAAGKDTWVIMQSHQPFLLR